MFGLYSGGFKAEKGWSKSMKFISKGNTAEIIEYNSSLV